MNLANAQQLILGRLYDEHADLGNVHLALRQQFWRLSDREQATGQRLQSLQHIINHLAQYSHSDHFNNEEMLFNHLRQITPKLALPRLQQIEKESQRFENILNSAKTLLASNLKPPDLLNSGLLENLSTIVTNHIQISEAVLFPAAKRYLSTHDWYSIAERVTNQSDLPKLDLSMLGQASSHQR